MNRTELNIAVIGAGPAGLTLALLASELLPLAQVSLFDARPAEHDISADPRTLALSLGSVQLLQRLHCWPEALAQSITEVHVSQDSPALAATFGPAEVRLRAQELGVERLGAVLSHGALVAELQRGWFAAAEAAPGRLHSHFGQPVRGVKNLDNSAEVDAGVAQVFDLAVVAEGGVFADQARKSVVRDYQQTAWVGTAEIEGATAGLAIERFTRHGPAALLPLPQRPGAAARASLVWCVDSRDDPVRDLSDTPRLAVLNTLFPPAAGRLVALSPLKSFALGLNAERSLVQGRSVRIGNAAQTLHPVAGQGLNLGLRDAFSLVDTLRWRGGDIDAALRRVEWARGPDRWAMIGATDFLARSFTWQWPGLAALRGFGLAALNGAGPLKNALARRMMFGSR